MWTSPQVHHAVRGTTDCHAAAAGVHAQVELCKLAACERDGASLTSGRLSDNAAAAILHMSQFLSGTVVIQEHILTRVASTMRGALRLRHIADIPLQRVLMLIDVPVLLQIVYALFVYYFRSTNLRRKQVRQPEILVLISEFVFCSAYWASEDLHARNIHSCSVLNACTEHTKAGSRSLLFGCPAVRLF